MLVHEMLGDHGPDDDRPGLVADGTGHTFGALRAGARRLAGWLQARAEPGDRVAMVADNCRAWVDAYYGVSLAGMVLVPLNQRLAPREQAALLTAAGASVLLGQSPYLDAMPAGTGVRHVAAVDDPVFQADLAAAASVRPVTGRRGSDLAWLLFTSGTTGRPKGAMLTHASLTAGVEVTAIGRPVAEDEVYVFPFPLCHVAGYHVLLHHRERRPVVLLSRFRADEYTAAVTAHGGTSTSLAPTMLASLLDHLDETDGALPTLRRIGYGASAIPPDLLRRAMQSPRLGGGAVEFAQGYGMTELSGTAVFLDDEAHRRGLADRPELLRAAGRPSPLVEIRLVDDAGNELGPGAVGEITVRGPQVMAGYWDDPTATAAAFTDGWFRTGDLGRWDDEGVLSVVDRKKDVVVSGGENVSSREVEDVLHEHPTVAAAAVVGVPDPYWGEAVCAVVVASPGESVVPDDIRRFVRERLAGFKTPRHVLVADALPVNAGGKVVKAELRPLAASAVAEGTDRLRVV